MFASLHFYCRPCICYLEFYGNLLFSVVLIGTCKVYLSQYHIPTNSYPPLWQVRRLWLDRVCFEIRYLQQKRHWNSGCNPTPSLLVCLFLGKTTFIWTRFITSPCTCFFTCYLYHHWQRLHDIPLYHRPLTCLKKHRTFGLVSYIACIASFDCFDMSSISHEFNELTSPSTYFVPLIDFGLF